MSTVTRHPAPFDEAQSTAPAHLSSSSRPAEPPWPKLAAAGAAIVAAMGLYVAVLAPDSTVPVPAVAYTGTLGPAGLVVTAVPLTAGAPTQALTLDLTRRRTGAPYEVLKGVSVRLTPPKGLAAAGGPSGPLKATMIRPGTWSVKLAGRDRVLRPGTWSLRVSGSIKTGQAFKRDVPVAYR
ncbi:MAG: hypothetical protein JWM31_2221 [Solirubrobacterales bacterium]|nr:hypothetical protein [Solirubrobacterales bacterium]